MRLTRRVLIVGLMWLLPSAVLAQGLRDPVVAAEPEVTADGLHVVVQFRAANGTTPQRDFYGPDESDIQRQVAAYLATTANKPTLTKGSAVVVTKETTDAVTAAQARAEWFASYARFLAVYRAVQAGVVPDTDPAYVALRERVAKTFASDYIDEDGWP